MDEIKKALEALQVAFNEFKSLNDQRLKQIESKGSADPVLEKSVEKANAEITRLEGEVKKMQTAMARTSTAEGSRDEKSVAAQARKESFAKLIRKGEGSLSPEELKTLSTVDDSQGGYFVPSEMAQEILRGLPAVNAFRGLASVRSISQGNTLEMPRRVSGVTGSWAAELASNPSATNPTTGLLRITAEEMRVLMKATPNMLEDAGFDIEGWLRDEAVEAFANLEGAAFITGNGVGKPMGIMSYASGTGDGQIEQVVSGSAATIADADGQANGLISMVHKLKAAYAKNAKFVLSRATVGSIRKLKDTNKQYIWQPGLGGNPPTILGYGYEEDDNVAVEAANALVVAFGDFKRAYQIVDKVGLAITRDPYSAKPLVEFLFRKRVGGQVMIHEAIKILKCST